MNKQSPYAAANILMIEQEPDSVRIIGELFKEHKLTHRLHMVSDHVEATNKNKLSRTALAIQLCTQLLLHTRRQA